MNMIKIETSDGNGIRENLINTKYIVRVAELYDGRTEILLESGDRYITNQRIYKIEEQINKE